MSRIVCVNGRKVKEVGNRYVILGKNEQEVSSVRKCIAKTPKEAVLFYMEQEDKRYVRMQDKMWDYV